MPLHKVEIDLSIEDAKALVGRIVAKVIAVTASGLKDFGDKSQVGRWCQGKENPNLARLLQRPHVRRALVVALAETCEDAEVNTEIRFRRVG